MGDALWTELCVSGELGVGVSWGEVRIRYPDLSATAREGATVSPESWGAAVPGHELGDPPPYRGGRVSHFMPRLHRAVQKRRRQGHLRNLFKETITVGRINLLLIGTSSVFIPRKYLDHQSFAVNVKLSFLEIQVQVLWHYIELKIQGPCQ